MSLAVLILPDQKVHVPQLLSQMQDVNRKKNGSISIGGYHAAGARQGST